MKKVLIAVLLTIIIIAQTSAAQRIYNPINGHLYEKFDTPMTWYDAKAYCESLGGYLATVTSQTEQDWIWDNLEPIDFYFGASDIEAEGVWKWVTGEPWDYTNWAPGEPNDAGGNEDVIVWIGDGRWNDINGDGWRRFVCEYEPSGNEIFVSEDGSDETGDGSPENPYRTIQHGIDMSDRRDVVRVLPGTYTENITLVSDLTVVGSGADQTIIMATGGNVVMANNVLNVGLTGFTIDGQGTASNGILCSGVTTMMIINDNIVTGAMNGIRCSESANGSIWSNTIQQNVETGVYYDGSANGDIKNNTIAENGVYGIQCRSTTTVTIQNNLIRGSSQEGIYVHDNASPTIHENTVTENKGYGIMVSGLSKPTITENHISQNVHGLWFRDTSVAKLYHNTIELNQFEGISCSSSGGTQIVGNTIFYNSGLGFYCNDVSNPLISENLIHSNRWNALYATHSSVPKLTRNIIRNNPGGISMDMSAQPVIGGNLTDANIIVDNSGWAIYNNSPNTINATFNYWGTTDEAEIAAMIQKPGGGSVKFKPFVTEYSKIIADTSGDGTISAYDAALILQYVVGLINQFPATNPIGQAAQKYIAGDITIAELDRILQGFGYPSVFKLLGYENQLLQNYPNPFNPETWIPFKLAQDTPVTISIYNAKGQLMRTIALSNRTAGIYTTKDRAVYWDGRNSIGQKVSSGVYYYTLQAGEFRATRKMVIMK